MITMNKKGHKNQAERSSRRLWITLLFFCFTVTGFMQAANAVFAQTTVTATFKNATLSEVLWEVQRQTDFTFVYSTEEVKNVKVEKLIVNHEKIANVLDKCFDRVKVGRLYVLSLDIVCDVFPQLLQLIL